MEEYGEAVAAYDRCIEIRKLLLEEGRLDDENTLVGPYFLRGNAYESLEECGKAIADYDRGIEIMERLKNTSDLYDEDSFAEAYAIKKAAMEAMQG